MNSSSASLVSGESHVLPLFGGAVRVGCAGWSLPAAEQPRFPPGASHLARYAARFPAVEINSSFHRPHRPATYARWAESVPAGFRFSVKLPKEITHQRRLHDTDAQVAAFLQETAALGSKLAAILVQLPPSFAFDAAVARRFFDQLRSVARLDLACEPRHPSWFTPEAEALLAKSEVARVAADPARTAGADSPGGATRFSYYRLHGSPKMYYSAYPQEFIEQLAQRIRGDVRRGRRVWCFFDNTTLGAATGNALALQEALAA